MSKSPTTRDRLRAHGIVPHKSLGQNFLTDPDMARRIVGYANITPADTVIEIGPGIGALTRHILNLSSNVIAIEIDRNLIPMLQQELGEPANLTIVQADALEVNFQDLIRAARPTELDAPIRFLGNLPYYITSAMIRRMLESSLNVQSIVLTVQLEVAERIVAEPDDMSLLAVSVQLYGKPELLQQLSPSVFYPQPDVESAVVRITPYAQPLTPNRDTLFDMARAGFSQRRKQLRNTIAAGLHLTKPAADQLLTNAGIDPTRRAETLSLQEWVDVSDIYARGGYATENRSAKRANTSANNSADPAPNAEKTTEL
jgi:16S rRNA (adenine1518-N6/adenine1519-N6)-dimethyltransferase